MIEFWWDGCCEPVNPKGHSAYGVHVEKDGKVVLQDSCYVGVGKGMSNNVGEYSGFLHILQFLYNKKWHRQKIRGYGDSMMIVNQMFGTWKMRGGLYIPYAVKAKKLLKKFSNIHCSWIPRDENSKADELSKKVLLDMGVKFRIQPE